MMGDHYDSISPSGQRGSVACACDSAGRRSVTYAKPPTSDLRQVCVRRRGKVRSPCRCLNSERNLGDNRLGPLPASTARRGHFQCPVPHRMGLGSASLEARFFINQPCISSTGGSEIVGRLGGVRTKGAFPISTKLAASRDTGQSKLKCCAARLICAGPQRATVRLDDRAADRKSYTHSAGFCREKWLENAFKVFRSYTRPTVTNRDQHITSLVCLGADT